MGGLATTWDAPSLLGGEDADFEDIDDEGEFAADGEYAPDRLYRPPSPAGAVAGALGAAAAAAASGEKLRGGASRKGTAGHGAQHGAYRSSARSLLRGLGDAARGATLLIDAIAPTEIDPRLAAAYLVAPRRGALLRLSARSC